MKKILITGANSYIGTSFERYLKENFGDSYKVDTIDMRDNSWTEMSFAGYDVVYHVAGIAHSDLGKVSSEKAKLLQSVNTDLAINTAKTAKKDGVRQFIFMSSAIVYGDSGKIGKKKVITKETLPNPSNCYGNSKLQAENGILPLQDEKFKVCILRPPMIYGKGCKGNFAILEKFAKKCKFFPYVKNERSMLYIGNFVEFLRLMVENEESGIFFPQNAEYSNTSELIKMIGAANNRKIHLIKGVSWILKFLGLFTRLIYKAFGNLCYSYELSEYKAEYRKFSLEESIKEIEKND